MYLFISIKIIITITLRVIGGRWVRVSKCTCTSTHAHAQKQYQSEVPPWIVRKNPKIENNWPCSIHLNWIIYSHINAILLSFKAINSLFKQCTFMWKAFNFFFENTVRTNAHLRGFTFTVWMGLCHNNVCSKHHFYYHRITKHRKKPTQLIALPFL